MTQPQQPIPGALQTELHSTPEAPALCMSAECDKIATALAKAQAAITAAKRDAKNPHFNSGYSTLAEVWEVIRGPLTQNGLALVQLPAADMQQVTVETRLVHSSGQWLCSRITFPLRPEYSRDGKPLLPSPHQIGSLVTYGRRYGAAAMVGVASDDDDDANAAALPGVAPPAAAAKATPAAPAAAPRGKRNYLHPDGTFRPEKPAGWGQGQAQQQGEGRGAPPDTPPAPPAPPPARSPSGPRHSGRAATQPSIPPPVQEPTAFHARLYDACDRAGISVEALEADLRAKGILQGAMTIHNLGEPIVNALLDGSDATSGRSNWEIVVSRITNTNLPF